MKDLSNKHTRAGTVYPRKRPSPHGVLKRSSPARRSPRSAKAALIQQRQRELQALALRRDGILLEEEYRDEIQRYMYEMEVIAFPFVHQFLDVELLPALHHVCITIYGPTTRDQVAYAPITRRLSRRGPLQLPTAP